MQEDTKRPRAREIGLTPGTLAPGQLNSITDVSGVKIGQETVILGDEVRTGVTAIVPHGGNILQEKVPAAIFVGNGFGKLVGSTQVNELGNIETPIMLTNTLCVGRVADALVDYMLSIFGNEQVSTVNPVVGETNDGYLNNIRSKQVGRDQVFRALQNASTGPVEEGCVGAGTGTRALGFKAGIGTSSRTVEVRGLGEFTVGVIVQSNFGGSLTISGVPVGRELAVGEVRASSLAGDTHEKDGGSVMVVIATDAPLEYRNLHRLAVRSFLGLARTGFVSENQSGDYFIAFSTAEEARIQQSKTHPRLIDEVRNDEMNPLFLGAIEATEEAVYNSLFRATTMKGWNNHVMKALPVEETMQVLEKHKAI